eukprot:1192362-Prorocentrum_minimum.AAC.1
MRGSGGRSPGCCKDLVWIRDGCRRRGIYSAAAGQHPCHAHLPLRQRGPHRTCLRKAHPNHAGESS